MLEHRQTCERGEKMLQQSQCLVHFNVHIKTHFLSSPFLSFSLWFILHHLPVSCFFSPLILILFLSATSFIFILFFVLPPLIFNNSSHHLLLFIPHHLFYLFWSYSLRFVLLLVSSVPWNSPQRQKLVSAKRWAFSSSRSSPTHHPIINTIKRGDGKEGKERMNT